MLSGLLGGQPVSPTTTPAAVQLAPVAKTQTAQPVQPAASKEVQFASTTSVKEVKPNPAPSAGLSNDNHYINSKGNTVHSPAYAPSIPEGASARCRDGTYSFSQSRRGTCSHHGGVGTWL
jgi:hypothetical protein